MIGGLRVLGRRVATRGFSSSAGGQTHPDTLFKQEVVYASGLGLAGAAVWWFFASKDIAKHETLTLRFRTPCF